MDGVEPTEPVVPRQLVPARSVEPTRYLLIEYWSEMLGAERHHADYSDEVAALESRRNELCLDVTPLGVFTALDVPSRFGPTWSQRDGV